jgi:hypothetical protein
MFIIHSANDCFVMFVLLQYSAALRSLIGEDRARHTLQVLLLHACMHACKHCLLSMRSTSQAALAASLAYMQHHSSLVLECADALSACMCMHAMCVYEQEVEAAVEADVAGGGQQQAAGQVSCVRLYFEQTDAAADKLLALCGGSYQYPVA